MNIDYNNTPVSPLCESSLPEQIDAWFKAFHQAKEMCGGSDTAKRIPPEKETTYLDGLVRGVYSKRDLPEGHVLTHEHINDDVYLRCPAGLKAKFPVANLCRAARCCLSRSKQDQAILIDMIDSPYAYNQRLKDNISISADWTHAPAPQQEPAKTDLRIAQ